MNVLVDQHAYRQWIPPEANLYMQPAWMDVFNPDWKARIAFDDEEDPVWLWPYQEKSRYFFKKYGRLAYCPDNGPIFLKNVPRDAFDPMIGRWMSLCLVDDRSHRLDHSAMTSEGWAAEKRTYQFFDLAQYPRDFQAVTRSKRKRMIRNGYLEFYLLENLSEASELLLDYFNLHEGRPLHYAELKRTKDLLDQSFDNYLFGIRNPRGDLLAVQWLVGYRDTLYGWVVVRDQSHSESDARELLLWHIIQWARDRYQVYDLGGSSIPGVRRFNLEMGAQDVEFFRYVRYAPPAAGRLRKMISI